MYVFFRRALIARRDASNAFVRIFHHEVKYCCVMTGGWPLHPRHTPAPRNSLLRLSLMARRASYNDKRVALIWSRARDYAREAGPPWALVTMARPDETRVRQSSGTTKLEAYLFNL